MADERPQYFDNHLEPFKIDASSLSDSLQELREAVRNGAQLIHDNDPAPEKWLPGGMFKHFPGVALAFLRLDYQSAILGDRNSPSPDYRQHAFQRIPDGLPEFPLRADKLSPAGSFCPVTPVILRALAAAAKYKWQSEGGLSLPHEDIAVLRDTVNQALKNGPILPQADGSVGGEDMLYGRAGLLWVLLNIRAHEFDEETQTALAPVLENIPELARRIIDAGRHGSREYTQKHGAQDAHPLMYPWKEGHYFFGAVHGITGILAILLACKQEEFSEYQKEIGDTITALCKFCIAQDGHLPMALPPYSYGQKSEFVQLCHGSPGMLILLATALKNNSLTREYWCPEWDQAILLATNRIWEEGILSKGGSLCHGIAGNAWPWLQLHDVFQYHRQDVEQARREYQQRHNDSSVLIEDLSQKLTPDFFLSRSLAFLLHARETRPYNSAPANSDRDYRLPDDPYSMFEGLAGNVCAWADACAVLQTRLRMAELRAESGCDNSLGLNQDEAFQEAARRILGFPLIGGNGAHGLL